MLEISDTVSLPIGIRRDGQVYRKVVIDEMIGLDEENMANPKFRSAPERAITALLQRAVQEIEGVLPRKKRSTILAPAALFQEMFAADREFLFIMIRLLSYGSEVDTDWTCEQCGVENSDTVDLSLLEVAEWGDDHPATISFELPRGLETEDGVVRKGTLRLPRGFESEMASKMATTNPNQAPTAMLTAMINDIEGVQPDRSMMQTMRSRDRQYLSNRIMEEKPGLDLSVDIPCSACGETNEGVAISMTDFFKPASGQS